MTSTLSKLLNPRSIAVIGATGREGRIGRILFENLMRSQRRLHPVHPEETTVLVERARILDALEELDINPLVFCQGRWTVLDAKLILT